MQIFFPPLAYSSNSLQNKQHKAKHRVGGPRHFLNPLQLHSAVTGTRRWLSNSFSPPLLNGDKSLLNVTRWSYRAVALSRPKQAVCQFTRSWRRAQRSTDVTTYPGKGFDVARSKVAKCVEIQPRSLLKRFSLVLQACCVRTPPKPVWHIYVALEC